MQYRKDPKSGNQLSVLGFGLMRLPRGITGTDLEKTTALVAQAIAGGVNYFDTAYVYPGSEVAFGRALETLSLGDPGLRDRIYLATKLPHQQCRKYEDFDRIFFEQLNRLKTDRVDYYLIHNLPSPHYWQKLVGLGVEGWIEEKKASGLIGLAGFSFHGKQDDFLQLLDMYPWDFCQIQYNYLDTNYQAGLVGMQAAHARQMMVVIMEPLRGGKLANGLPQRALALLKAAEPETSAAAWALRWIWDQEEPTVVLSGMNAAEQLQDNLKTAMDAEPGMLSAEQKHMIGQVVSIVEGSYKIACTGCNYCMPCPDGVNIPDCFAAYNTRAANGFIAGVSQYMTGIASPHPERYSGPGRCRACGNCEKKCPQNLAIIESLKQVKRTMEPWWYKPAMAVMRRVMG